MLGAPEYNAPVMIVWTSKVALWADRGPVFCCQDFPHERNHMAGAQEEPVNSTLKTQGCGDFMF